MREALTALLVLLAADCAGPSPAHRAAPRAQYLAAGPAPTATNTVTIALAPHPFAADLRPASPFGINTAFHPDTPDLADRLKAMQNAGIKWGRQDFTWR